MTAESKNMTLRSLILNSVISALFYPSLMLLLAGSWRWVEGWIFALWFDVMLLFNMIYLYFKDPALLTERSKRPGSDNQKPWDKYLMVGILLTAVSWLVILPLDAGRFHWSPAIPLWLKIAGGLALIPALYLIERATIDNTYLSAMVRIQDDRKQRVITTGSYGFVRHPLYLGCMLMMFGAPLMMGSLYGIIISAVGSVGLIGRILGEEKMLAEELDGYQEYAQQVRYRLIPLIW